MLIRSRLNLPRQQRKQMPDFIYSKTTGNYRYKSTGNAVPPSRVNGWIDKAADRLKQNLGRIAEDHRAGRINLAEWVIQTGEELRNAHRAVTMIAVGGKQNMTQSDWGFVGATIRRELQYLNNFANTIENRPPSTQLTEAFVSRAKSYSAAIYETYEKARRRRIQRETQADFEENVLEPGAEHCSGCLSATAQGVVPIGTLTEIGDRECGSKCRCRIRYWKQGANGEMIERGVRPAHHCGAGH